MSLTSLIKQRRDISDYLVSLIKEIPKMPKMGRGVVPRTRNFSEIGTAYDYAFRFEILRLYPFAKEKEWIAKAGANLIIRNEAPFIKKWQTPALRTLEEARMARVDYYSNPNSTNLRKMVEMCFRLSALDMVFREFKLPSDPVPKENLMPEPQKLDVNDVVSMLNRSKEFTGSNRFKESSLIILNPTFGTYSTIVGGADADVITSNSLIDLKTSTQPRISNYELAQIVGYYLLLQMNVANPLKAPSTSIEDFPNVKEIGIFYPRYGGLYCIPTDSIELNKDKLLAFLELIKSRPVPEYNPLEKLRKVGYRRSRTLNKLGIKTVENLAQVVFPDGTSKLVDGIHLESYQLLQGTISITNSHSKREFLLKWQENSSTLMMKYIWI